MVVYLTLTINGYTFTSWTVDMDEAWRLIRALVAAKVPELNAVIIRDLRWVDA